MIVLQMIEQKKIIAFCYILHAVLLNVTLFIIVIIIIIIIIITITFINIIIMGRSLYLVLLEFHHRCHRTWYDHHACYTTSTINL